MLGITLIALVVTIVVLLILAGITISLVFSDNGIIKKAQEAANKTQEAVNREQSELNQLYNELESALNSVPEPEPEPPLPSDGTYSEIKGINTPNLGSGMTAIKWNGSAWEETDGSDPDWYDYSAKKWANAKVEVDGVESYFVWIPRYAYRITSGYHSSTTGTIEIEFLKGTSNEGATGQTIVEYNSSTTSNYTQFPNGYVVHPAFAGDANVGGGYGNNNGASDNGISGIWVAKFEASPVGATTDVANSEYDGTDKKLQVVPGVSSWRSITIGNAYTVCLNYNPTLNSHMMKNSEWGAVAYLSRSKYGKNDEVTINYNGSYYTGGGSGNAYVENTDQSTTGNVWGVYDMSGGTWERVAAYVNNGNSSLTSYGNSLYTSTDAKTKNVYTAGSGDTELANYNANTGRYGDAIYETSSGTYNLSGDANNQSWYGDYSLFSFSNTPFFGRGGNYDGTAITGVFAFGNDVGNAAASGSFRPVLVTL